MLYHTRPLGPTRCAICATKFQFVRRFVGLTRASRIEEQVHAERLLTREKNMVEAVKLLTGGVGINYIPMTSVTPVGGVFPPPCFAAKNFASINLKDGDNPWKKNGELPAALAPAAARASAMVHLAVCVKRARQTNPSENARWALCVFRFVYRTQDITPPPGPIFEPRLLRSEYDSEPIRHVLEQLSTRSLQRRPLGSDSLLLRRAWVLTIGSGGTCLIVCRLR